MNEEDFFVKVLFAYFFSRFLIRKLGKELR